MGGCKMNLEELEHLCSVIEGEKPTYFQYKEPKVDTNSLKTKEEWELAVQNDGLVLATVPTKLKLKKLCASAVKQNGFAFAFLPSKFQTSEFLDMAVKSNGLASQIIPQNLMNNSLVLKKKELCKTACLDNLWSFEFFLDYLTERNLIDCLFYAISYKESFSLTKESYVAILSFFANYPSENFGLDEFTNDEGAADDDEGYHKKFQNFYFKYLVIIANLAPDELHNHEEVIKLENATKLKRGYEKKFSEEHQKFLIQEVYDYDREDSFVFFDTFSEFYLYLYCDLDGADLSAYDFKGVSLKDYEIDYANTLVNSKVLIEQNLYDPKFYSESVGIMQKDDAFEELIMVEDSHALALPNHPPYITSALQDDSRRIFYISDLHLDHKLKKHFPDSGTELEITCFIKKFVERIFSAEKTCHHSDYLCVLGDVSCSLGICKLFYEAVTELWVNLHGEYCYGETSSSIVVILGNHEVWHYDFEHLRSKRNALLPQIVRQYRDLCKDLGIIFLHNELLVAGSGYEIISEQKIQKLSSEELKEICRGHSLMIYGGLGFSGLCENFNASHGIYRETIPSIAEDFDESQKFKEGYNKILSVLEKDKVIVLSHTPKENWCTEPYNPNWIYVSGHTHRNTFTCDESKTVYADNQLGYRPENAGLKYFELCKFTDSLRFYPDGIHEITREEYLQFNRGKGIVITFNRKEGRILCIKREKIMVFLWLNRASNVLYLLVGGAITKLKHQEIEYYYENLAFYVAGVRHLLRPLHERLKAVSGEVRKIGGSGKIHGSIVDVDFYTHISIDPNTGKLQFYNAESVGARTTYPELGTLLQEHRPDLYYNLLAHQKEGIVLFKNSELSVKGFSNDTKIYSDSRILKDIQHLLDSGVIRRWEERVMDLVDSHKIENSSHLLENANVALCKESVVYVIRRYCQEGKFMKEYPSAKEACEDISVNDEDLQVYLKRGKDTSAAEIWRKELKQTKVADLNLNAQKPFQKIRVALYKNSVKIGEYSSITEASKMTDFTVKRIRYSLDKKHDDGILRQFDSDTHKRADFKWVKIDE